MTIQTREQWLTIAATILVDEIFTPATTIDTPRYRVSMTAPKTTGRSSILGQCWNNIASADLTYEIFITAALGETDSNEILAVLVHELVHAYVGIEEQHNNVFAALCRKVGLEGGQTAKAKNSFTATVASDALKIQLDEIISDLGHIPHAKIDAANNGIKKQSNRQLLMYCSNDCGFKFRASQKMIDSINYKYCLVCGDHSMIQETK